MPSNRQAVSRALRSLAEMVIKYFRFSLTRGYFGCSVVHYPF
jgi:hypothetical protein